MTRTIDDLLAGIFQSYADTQYRVIEDEVRTLSFWNGTPIERAMGVALYSWARTYNSASLKRDNLPRLAIMHPACGTDYSQLLTERHDRVLTIWTQVKVDQYTADFLVRYRHGDAIRWIAVECDGHDFHERTKEQAAHDRARDRHFQTRGLSIFRFTGSEIWRDTMQCIDQLYNFCTVPE